MTFEELNENRLRKSDYLWRYFNIHGFLTLITKKILVFSRLDISQIRLRVLLQDSLRKDI